MQAYYDKNKYMDLCKTLIKYESHIDEARIELYNYFPKLFYGAIKRL